MNHAEIRAAVNCPRCGARAGDRCIQSGKRITAIHPARSMAAETLGGWRAGGKPIAPATSAEKERRRAARYDRRR